MSDRQESLNRSYTERMGVSRVDRASEMRNRMDSTRHATAMTLLLSILLVSSSLFATGCDKAGDSQPKGRQDVAQDRAPVSSAPTIKKSESHKPVEPGGYINEQFGFSMTFPPDWKQTENTGSNVVVQAVSPQANLQDPFGENVYVMVGEIPEETRLDEYVNRARAEATKHTSELYEHKVGVTALADTASMWIIFSHEVSGTKCKAIRYYLRKGPRLYVITCTAVPKTFSSFQKRFETIAKSFRFQ